MTGIDTVVTIVLGIIAICVIVAYWPLIITAIAIWAVYDQYGSHGATADYTLIFICWSIAFIVLSKLLGSPFDGSNETDYAYDDDRRRKLADKHRREVATRVAQHHQREFNKRF
jgi:uncharacterized membrane protein